MTNKYPPESPTPNWPVKLNPNVFSNYCDAVIDGVTAGIKRVLQAAESEGRASQIELATSTLYKWQNRRSELTIEELNIIHDAYELEVSWIHLLSE